jgi:hypothetical protein
MFICTTTQKILSLSLFENDALSAGWIYKNVLLSPTDVKFKNHPVFWLAATTVTRAAYTEADTNFRVDVNNVVGLNSHDQQILFVAKNTKAAIILWECASKQSGTHCCSEGRTLTLNVNSFKLILLLLISQINPLLISPTFDRTRTQLPTFSRPSKEKVPINVLWCKIDNYKSITRSSW